MPETIIKHLADYPQFIPACASWAYSQWGTQKTNGSLDRAMQQFTKGAQHGAMPLTLIAFHNDLPAGMASLWQNDCEERPTHTPWLAALFVHPNHRKKGIAAALVQEIENEAKLLGFEELNLITMRAALYYKKLTWQEKEQLTTTHGLETIMTKQL